MRYPALALSALLALASCGSQPAPTPAAQAPAVLVPASPAPRYVQQTDNLMVEVYDDYSIVRLKQYRTRAQYRWSTDRYLAISPDLWITNRIYAGQGNHRTIPAGAQQGVTITEIPY